MPRKSKKSSLNESGYCAPGNPEQTFAKEVDKFLMTENMMDVPLSPSRQKGAASIKADMQNHALERLNLFMRNVTLKHALFMSAIEYNNLELFSYVLQEAEPYFNPAANHNLALLRAIELGRLEMIMLLLRDKRVDPTQDNLNALNFAIRMNQEGSISLLVKDERVMQALLISAIKLRNVARVERILIAWKDINISFDNNLPLMTAIDLNCIDIVQCLLQDVRLDPSLNSNAPLYQAIRLGRTEIVNLLLMHPQLKLLQHISEATHYKNEDDKFLELFQVCFSPDSDVQSAKSRLYNATLRAALKNRYDVFEKLIDLPWVDLTINDFHILKFICYYGNFQMLAELIQKNLKTNHLNVLDSKIVHTLLKISILRSHHRCVEILLSLNGLNLNTNHSEALYLALSKQDIHIFSLLVRDRRFDLYGRNYALYIQTLMLQDLSFFEILYARTSFSHLDNVSKVIESTLITCAEHAPELNINRKAIETIKAKYHQSPFLPLYANKQTRLETSKWIDDCIKDTTSQRKQGKHVFR